MRIALVRRGYSSSGGAEKYLLRLAEGLVRHGHEPVLVSGAAWPDNTWPHGPIERLPAHSPRAFANALHTREMSAGWDRIFSLERVWHCHAYRAGDGVHAAWLKRRQAFEPFWRGWFRNLLPKHRALLHLEKNLFSGDGAEAIIANSHFVAAEIISFYNVDPAKIHIIPNGYDAKPQLPPEQRLQLAQSFRIKHGLEPNAPLALFVGSGWERKGLKTAINALNLCAHPHARLVIAGRNRHASRYHHPKALFLGPVKDPVPLLNACDVFILPTWYDPFSNACLEAAAHGLPVVTTEANGFISLIQSPRHGKVIPPGDSTALATALNHWFDHPPTNQERATIANHARQFNIARNVSATLHALGWENL